MAKFNRNNQWNISRSVAIVNLFYLFYYGGKACLFPFITLYFRSLGLSATQTGIICGVKYLVWCIAAPLWIFMANRLQKTKIVLGISLLLSIASCLAITLVQPANFTNYLAPCLLESTGSNLILPDIQSPLQNQTEITETPPKIEKSTATKIPKTEVKILSTFSSTTLPYENDKKLSNYQLAVAIFPDVLKNKISDEVSLDNFLKSSERTNTYPQWKLKILRMKLMGMLEKYENDSENIPDQLTPRPSVNSWEIESTTDYVEKLENFTQSLETSQIVKSLKTEEPTTVESSLEHQSEITKKTVYSSQPKHHNFDQDSDQLSTLEQLLDRLIPIYLERRESNPGLTISAFLAHEHGTKEQKFGVRNYLAQAMQRELDSDNIEKRSLNNQEFDNDTENETIVETTILNKNDFNSTLKKTVENLVTNILPSITDNIGVFVLLLAIVAAGESLSAPTELLCDKAFYEFLDELDSLDKYGRHKLLGLIGTLLCGITISFVVYFSPCVLSGSIVSFHIHFYGFAVLIGISFLIAPFFPTYKSNSKSTSASDLCPSCTSLFCSDCRLALLLLTVFIVGVTQSAVQDFILWEVQDLSGSELVYGSYVSTSAFCSILSMVVSRRIIKALKPCISGPLSLFCIALQLLLYSYMYLPWMVVPIQLLNILGQSFLWAVINHQTNLTMTTTWSSNNSVRRTNEVYVFARASQQRALQTAYLMTYQGISFACGSILAGIAYDLSSGTLVPFLRLSAGFLTGWAVIYMLYQCCCFPNRRQRKYSKLLEDSADEEDFIYNANDHKNSCFMKIESNGGYITNNGSKRTKKTRKRGLREKRRNKEDFFSSSNDEDYADESDWLKMALKKDSRAL